MEQTGPVDSWGVPATDKLNFKMKIAARMLGDSKVTADSLRVPAAVKLNFKMKIAARI